jgi:polyisoprenyl-teichoic acid--peptidoglycan teichoic acid transferase
MAKSSDKKKGEIVGWLIIGFMICILLGIVIAAQFFRSEEKLEIEFRNGQIISFVIAGYNEDKIVKGVLAVFFNSSTNRIAIISIPVKTYLYFGKSVYYTIEESFTKKIGNDIFKSAIEKILNTRIDYYIYLDKNYFIKFIDMIGGVEVYSPKLKNVEMKVDIPDGLTLFDGDKAVEYLNFILDNKQESTYEHLKRVQNFFRGMLKLKSDFLDNINESIIVNYLYKIITTNLTKNDSLILFHEIKERYKKQVTDFSLGSENIILYCDKKSIPGYDYILLPKKSGEWIKGEVKEGLANLNKKIKPDETNQIAIEVQNGTDIIGLGLRAKKYLETYGFNILEVLNADNNNYQKTVIITRNSEQKALKLAELIRCKQIVKGESYIDKKIDVTIILGKDFDGNVVK